MAKKKAAKKKPTQKNGKADAPLGTYFLSMSVENVRCFGEQQTLDLSDDEGKPARWTLILGENGTGKTTLLQALAFYSFYEQQQVSWGNGKKIVEGPWKFGEIWKSLELFDSFHIMRSEHDYAHIFVDLCTQGNLSIPKPSSNRFNARFADFGWQESPVAGHGSGMGGQFEPIECFQSYSSIRQFYVEFADEDVPPYQPFLNLVSDKQLLIDARKWLLQLDYSASKASKITTKRRAYFTKVKEIIIDLLPDVTDIRISIPTDNRPVPDVEFSTSDGWVRYAGIAHGYKSIASLIIDLAAKLIKTFPNLDNPLEGPAVVLVDEIDLHLHPRWQRDVMSYLSKHFPNTQFIATAHSPLIVQAAAERNANIVVLRRSGDEVVIDNDPLVIKSWRLDQILESDLFGVSPRPKEVQEKIDKRREILAKPKLSSNDKKQLARLEEEIGLLPVTEDETYLKTEKLLQQAEEMLEKQIG